MIDLMIVRFSTVLLFLTSLSLLPPDKAFAQRTQPQPRIIYVDASASGAEDGSTWEKAYRTLEKAFEAAEGGNQIWVAEGEYSTGTPEEFDVTDHSPGLACFTVEKSVQLFGGFPSFNSVSKSPGLIREQLSDRRPLTYRTVMKRGTSRLYMLLSIKTEASFDGFFFSGKSPLRKTPIFSESEDKFAFIPLINVTTSETVTFSRCLFRLT